MLFVQQTFSRLASTALQHVQPWWFYVPVSLLLLFPWFPLLPLAFRAEGRDARTLSAVSLFGLVFFSVAVNKLPGYLLPLMPAACVLLALGLKQAAHPGRWLASSLVLLGMMPMLSEVVPLALAKGLARPPSVPSADGKLQYGNGLGGNCCALPAVARLASEATRVSALVAVVATLPHSCGLKVRTSPTPGWGGLGQWRLGGYPIRLVLTRCAACPCVRYVLLLGTASGPLPET